LSPGSELAAAGLRQILHDTSTDKGMVLLAKSEDRPIGFGCVLFDDHRDPSYHEAERHRAYLATSTLRPNGAVEASVGRCWAFMEAEARARGCSRFLLPCHEASTGKRCQEQTSRKGCCLAATHRSGSLRNLGLRGLAR
jgi:hypothetical protein